MSKNKGGRPSKYKEAYVKEVDVYLQPYLTGEVNNLPTRFGFAQHLSVDTTTIWEWDKKHKEFSNAIKKIDETQKQQLMNHGLYGGKEVNSTMAIFLLKANHGLKEASELEIKGEGFNIVLDTDGKQKEKEVHADS